MASQNHRMPSPALEYCLPHRCPRHPHSLLPMPVFSTWFGIPPLASDSACVSSTEPSLLSSNLCSALLAFPQRHLRACANLGDQNLTFGFPLEPAPPQSFPPPASPPPQGSKVPLVLLRLSALKSFPTFPPSKPSGSRLVLVSA